MLRSFRAQKFEEVVQIRIYWQWSDLESTRQGSLLFGDFVHVLEFERSPHAKEKEGRDPCVGDNTKNTFTPETQTVRHSQSSKKKKQTLILLGTRHIDAVSSRLVVNGQLHVAHERNDHRD